MGDHTEVQDRWDCVSILVFVELALDEGACSSRSGLVDVSILVFVELALDVHQIAAEAVFGRVSILVFVELALDGRFVCY